METNRYINGKPYIVKRLSVTATLTQVPSHTIARFSRLDLQVKEKTLASIISRLNSAAGHKEFDYEVDPATADYLITRK